MKKLFILFSVLMASVVASAQVPDFANTVGNGKLYTYTSVKFSHGDPKNLETYTTFQYGIGNQFATGLSLYTYGSSAYLGYIIRGNFYKSKYFNIGAQFIPSFDLGNQHKFSYATTILYMNGKIYDNLFWCSNTSWTANRTNTHSLNELMYLGYYIDFKDKGNLTPMVGYSLNSDLSNNTVYHDLAIGAYYGYGPCNFYLWCDKIINKAPRIVIAVDITLNVK